MIRRKTKIPICITELPETKEYIIKADEKYFNRSDEPITILVHQGAFGLSHGDIIAYKDNNKIDVLYEFLGIATAVRNNTTPRAWFRRLDNTTNDICTGFISRVTYTHGVKDEKIYLYTAGKYHGLSKQVEIDS